jgi:hypothetical protein
MLTVLSFLLANPAVAGERLFGFSYGYGTVPKGAIEVEHYATAVQMEGGGSNYDWTQQLELEYGITDHLEGALYVVAAQANEGPLTFKGYKARLKYRLGSEGVGPVDPAIYLEYIGSPTFEEHGVEAKVILGKTVGRFETALNVEYKLVIEEDELEHELEPTLGLGYRLVPGFAFGAEAVAEVEWEEDEMGGPFLWAGPMVHLAGEGGRLWWTVSGLVGVTEDTREDHGFMVRSLLGVNL